jgi:acyl carrier protein
MYNNIINVINKALCDTLNLPVENIIKENTRLCDLGLDSMSTLSFLMALEDGINDFVVDPDRLDTKDLETVGTVISYVSSEITQARAA